MVLTSQCSEHQGGAKNDHSGETEGAASEVRLQTGSTSSPAAVILDLCSAFTLHVFTANLSLYTDSQQENH